MKMKADYFLKNRLVVMKIARDFIVTDVGSQIKTINDYVEKFSVARGTVQAAMAYLIEHGCIETQFKGQYGTILTKKNQKQLWEYSGFGRLLGALSIPLNLVIAGLATGVCNSMSTKDISFNFAFVQGSNSRLWGLEQNKYEFIIATNLTEQIIREQHESIEKIMDLKGCTYTNKYVVLFADTEKTKIEDNMTIAVDPSFLDQIYLLKLLSKNNSGIVFKQMSYMNTVIAVLRGEADVTITRQDSVDDPTRYCELELPDFSQEEINRWYLPAIYASKDNYGIGNILKYALDEALIAKVQQEVIDQIIPPNYF